MAIQRTYDMIISKAAVMKICSLILISTMIISCVHSPSASNSQNTVTKAPTAHRKTAETPSEGIPAVVQSDEDITPVKDIDTFHLDEQPKEEAKVEELETIPTEINPLVEKWISYFQGRGSIHMERYLARSSRYEKLMKKVLRDNGLPEDLFYIALIESGFNGTVRSHAAAVGYWQFIRGTGKRYGLEINPMVDERRDPVLATQAAAEYFKGLYSVFGSWYLAMASYNVGENRVKKETVNHGTMDFWELARKKRLPKETINYVPKFIAAKLIAKDPAKYGFEDIDYLPPIEFDHITISQPVNLRLMAEKLNYNYEDFKALNPKFKGEIAPLKNQGETVLRIPVGMSESASIAAKESVVDKAEFIADAGDTSTYKLKRGESLLSVARKFRTSVAYLRDLNDLPKRKKLKVGTVLYVPDRTPLKEKSKKYRANSVAGVEAGSKLQKFHIVQYGDSLVNIAQKYKVSLETLKKVNSLKKGRTLKVGSKLIIPDGLDEERGESRNGSMNSKSNARKLASLKNKPKTKKVSMSSTHKKHRTVGLITSKKN